MKEKFTNVFSPNGVLACTLGGALSILTGNKVCTGISEIIKIVIFIFAV